MAYVPDLRKLQKKLCKTVSKFIIPEKFKPLIGKVTESLTPLVTEKRISRMNAIAKQRSLQVCTVFENTHHAHNISAVLRTMDSLGFLDVFFLYNNPHIRFRAHDSIDRSASQWLNIKNFQNIPDIVRVLKQNGYKIALVSRPDFSRTADSYRSDLKAFSTNEFVHPEFLSTIENHKIALVFGTELFGVSEEWVKEADFYAYVNMYGFCESLNVSVCAGIILNSLRDALTKNKLLCTLSEADSNLLVEHWIAKDTPHAYEYIANKHPELLDYYAFIKKLEH